MVDRRDPNDTWWNILPRLVGSAQPLVWLVIGFVTLVLGLLIVVRPLTSMWLLALYIGVSAIASGVLDLISGQAERRWHRALAVVWIGLGAAILIGFGRSLDLLPDVIALLLIVAGLDALGGMTRGVLSRRVLSVAWGGAQIAFGVLALSWPDVTVLVVAVVFGLRTAGYGVFLIVRGFQQTRAADRAERADPPRPAGTRRRLRFWSAAGRYVAAVLVVSLAVAGWGVDDWLEDGAPVVDAFYDPPDEVPEHPGALLRDAPYLGRIPPGGTVRRILYTTTDTHGAPAVASALVIAPATRPIGARPVIAWNHGTTGVARACAPSLSDAAATRWAIPGVVEALERGYVVVASDYSGQGAPGVFPYLIGQGEARSTLDAVRAAAELPGMQLRPDVVVWGHSQGGHAALWTSQIAPEYAPELRIRGTAAIAPVADPYALAQEFTRSEPSGVLSVLVSWVLVPYADTYPDVDLADYVAPGGRRIVREMTHRCPSEPGAVVSVLAALGVSVDRSLYDGDLTAGAMGRRLQENRAEGPWPSPILLAWGVQDEVVPPHLQEDTVQRLCAAGVPTRRLAYQAYDHTGVMLPGSRFIDPLLEWTRGRFTRTDTRTDDCPQLAREH